MDPSTCRLRAGVPATCCSSAAGRSLRSLSTPADSNLRVSQSRWPSRLDLSYSTVSSRPRLTARSFTDLVLETLLVSHGSTVKGRPLAQLENRASTTRSLFLQMERGPLLVALMIRQMQSQ